MNLHVGIGFPYLASIPKHQLVALFLPTLVLLMFCCFRGPRILRCMHTARQCNSSYMKLKEKLPSVFETSYNTVTKAGKRVTLYVEGADPGRNGIST